MTLPMGFSQNGSIVACALLSLACNVPQSHLWLLDRASNPDRSPLYSLMSSLSLKSVSNCILDLVNPSQ